VQVPGFEEVYEAEYVRMVRVAAMLTGSTASAERVVQDAYVTLYPRFGAVADPAEDLYRSIVEASRSADPADVQWSALSGLIPRTRAVVVLRCYAGLHPAEIAAILGCSIGTVRATLELAGDEAGHRERLAALAVTVAVTPGWERIRARVDAAPSPARRGGVLVASRLGRLAGVAAAVVLAITVVIARHDDGGIETAHRTTPTTSTSERRVPATTAATTTTAAPPPVAGPEALPGTVPADGGAPAYDLSRTLDLLGLGPEDPAADGDDEAAAGGEQAAAPEPEPEPEPSSPPSSAPDATTPPTTVLLVHVRTPEPPAQGPDGWPVAQANIWGFAGWFIVTYHVEDGVFSFAEWIVDEYAEPIAVDTFEFSLRPGQNCLVTGAATDPYEFALVPYRLVAGVVRADAEHVETIGGLAEGGPHDLEMGIGAEIGPEIVPGLRTWIGVPVFDYLRVEVKDAGGTVLHTASETDRDAFPDTC
jgi:DNA-directed RNA polymerase specialized sigma24 family protein